MTSSTSEVHSSSYCNPINAGIGTGVLAVLCGGSLGGYQVYQLCTHALPSSKDSILAITCSIALMIIGGVLAHTCRRNNYIEESSPNFSAKIINSSAPESKTEGTHLLIPMPTEDNSTTSTTSLNLTTSTTSFSPIQKSSLDRETEIKLQEEIKNLQKEIKRLKESLREKEEENNESQIQVSYLQNQLVALKLQTEIDEEATLEEALETISTIKSTLEVLTQNVTYSDMSSASFSGFNSATLSPYSTPTKPQRPNTSGTPGVGKGTPGAGRGTGTPGRGITVKKIPFNLDGK